MVDTTNPLPSITEPVIDRYRRWNPVWYRWIKPLLETVRSASDAIQETIDQINGKWSLSVNLNNRVTGAITLDGSQSESVFGVLADKFVIIHPSDDGTTIQAFVIGLVNGVSTVGINGDLIVDDTIIARHILAGEITADKLDVSELSAINADIGTATAGRIESADGTSYWDLDSGELVIGAPS